jgi:hypothetical protein
VVAEFGSLGGLMRQLESAGEASTQRRLADLRPWGTKNRLGPELAGRLARFLRCTDPREVVSRLAAEGAWL